MFSGEGLRTALIGGYNKEDVREYIQAMEKEAEVTKFGFQSELIGLKEELKKAEEEKENRENLIREYERRLEEHGNIHDNVPDRSDLFGEDLNTLKAENEDFRQQIADLETEKFLLIESKKRMEEQLKGLKADRTVVQEDIQENIQLEEEMRQLKEKKEKYEEDYNAIAKVLEDARLSARYIQEEAQKQAEEIIAQAKKKSEELIEYRKAQIDKELEDKGIRLMAAKYKIDAYRKEINSTQQKLYNLYSDMGKMIEEMPKRLEQLWEEEDSSNADNSSVISE